MNELSERVGILTLVVKKQPSLGRAALMKYCYFLQTLRGVPLEYSFRLYSYGPFDSDVLADLDSAEGAGSIKSEVTFYPAGYGYRIEPGQKADAALQRASEFVSRYEPDVDWVLERFGLFSASDLELYSTVVYCNREAVRRSEGLGAEEMAGWVHDVKPHFTEDYIEKTIQKLGQLNLLATVDREA